MRFLFVLGNYDPVPSANGVCTISVQKKLFELGASSDVICCFNDEKEYASTIGDGVIYTIDYSLYELDKLSTLQKMLYKIKRFFCWPLNSREETRKFKKKIREVLDKNIYDAIVCVVKPLDSAFAYSSILSNHKTPMIIYELDSITDSNLNMARNKRMFSKRIYKYEKKIYKAADKIIHLECHKDFYSNARYDFFRDKFVFSDVPLIEEKKKDSLTSSQNAIIFTGFLNKGYREPHYFVSLFEKACLHMDIKLSFYSNGSCENDLKELAAKNNKIKRCGYIKNSELQTKMNEASFFLDIGLINNNGVSPISSKIFSYFSFGKPVIHIREKGKDSALPYFEKYPLSLIIDPEDDFNLNVNKLKEFLNLYKNKTIPFECVAKTFEENTPLYTAKLLINLVKD